MKKLEKVLLGISVCTGDLCKGCPYEAEEACTEELHRETLEVLKLVKEKAGAALPAGVPPMPCAVGDTLWFVFRDEMGDVHVSKDTVTGLQFTGGEWLVGDSDNGYQALCDGVFLRLEEAVKYAEELLRHG